MRWYKTLHVHYKLVIAVQLYNALVEAWSYKGELCLDQGSLEDASAAYTSLSNLAVSTAASGAGTNLKVPSTNL